MRKVMPALVLAVLAVACTDQPVAPANDVLTPQASIAQRGSIHLPNSPVWRWADRIWYRANVQLSGYDWQLVYYDAPVAHPACNGGQWFGEPPLWESMYVAAQNGDDNPVHGDDAKVIFSGQANDLPLVVYDNPTWLAVRAQYGALSPEFCAFLQTGYLYRGIVEVRAGDNDRTGAGAGMNVWGVHTWGQVSDLAGSRYMFDLRTRYKFEAPDYFRVVFEEMSVRPLGR